MGFEEEDYRGHFHHIILRVHVMNINLKLDVNFDHLARVEVVSFLQSNVTFLPPYPQCILSKEVTMHSPHLRSRKLCSASLRAE